MNTDGSYTCICKPGCVGDGRTTCNGKPSSTHLVSLPSLYIFSPLCLLPSVDVNECSLTNPCGTGTCTNLVCGYSCGCQTGYQPSHPVANNVTCIGKSLSNDPYTSCCYVLLPSSDIDECALSLSNCSSNATCSNTVGSYTCTCKQGFSGNGRNCTGMIYMVHLLMMANSTSSRY